MFPVPLQPDASLSEQAKQRQAAMRGEPLFYSDWDRVLMLHFAVDPVLLQAVVPFPLDLHEGMAYVSLVSFEMQRLRFSWGGKWSSRLLAPIATHRFLNVRTYVQYRGEPGIYFLAEWLPNRLSVSLGRPCFGLPYRWGSFQCEHQHEQGRLSGRVEARDGPGLLEYAGTVGDAYAPAARGSREEFLMERYTAFTYWRGIKRLFRIWHEPWQQAEANISIHHNTLLQPPGEWAEQCSYLGASYAPRADSVWMSRPSFIP